MQVIAAPEREAGAWRIAAALEQMGSPWQAALMDDLIAHPPVEPEINIPAVFAEVTAAFERYEQALNENDVAMLDAIFRDAPYTIRFGLAENLYGSAQIAAFRSARTPPGIRVISGTVITTFGRDFATASTLFHRGSNGRTGRQMQSWVRFPEGWRVVAAHVSWMD
ncbi:MAG TPA: oxalurate catabolism protein HpxZ [Stellaceae bacterium]|nr:oxalurate catabolism protein HpxZ [Stellaceae bacterium]